MKPDIRIFFAALLATLITALHACSQTTAAGKLSPSAVFVASTPCSEGTRPVPGIPREGGCELIKWNLRLFGNAEKEGARTYVLDCDYGMPKQGTRGFINGGSHLHREGKWTVVKGRGAKPAAVMYRLDPDTPRVSISFLRLNGNVIHLLDSKQQLMIGTGGWSYTLNRSPQ